MNICYRHYENWAVTAAGGNCLAAQELKRAAAASAGSNSQTGASAQRSTGTPHSLPASILCKPLTRLAVSHLNNVLSDSQ